MTDQTGKPNTNPTPGAAELTIAQRLDAASLPGTFRKKGVIAAGEMGLFVSGGQVKKTLGTGEHTLGRDESLVKIRSMPFSIKLGFFQLLSGGEAIPIPEVAATEGAVVPLSADIIASLTQEDISLLIDECTPETVGELAP